MAVPLSFGIFLVLGVLAVYIVKRFNYSKSSAYLPLPPGPKGLPIVGNFNDLPKPGVLEAHHWVKHKDLYGPVSSITVFGKTFIIINDAQVALDLLRDRSINNSGRPSMPFCEMWAAIDSCLLALLMLTVFTGLAGRILLDSWGTQNCSKLIERISPR